MFNINPKQHLSILSVILASVFLLSGCGLSTKSDHEYVEEAQKLYLQKNYQGAIIGLKNALQANSNNPEARALLGKIYAETGQGENAEKELKQAARLGISFETIAYLLGDALLQQGKSDELIAEFRILDDDSEHIAAAKAVMIGEAYLQQKIYAEADNFFNLAIKHESVKPRALLGQSLLALINGKPKQAKALVAESLSINKASSKAWLTQADVHRALGENEEVLVAYQNAIDYAHTNKDYYYQVGMRQKMGIQLNNGEVVNAETTFNELKKSFYKQKPPGELTLTYLRANLAYQKKDFSKASELANQALLIRQSHLGSKLIAGSADAILGKHEQAETHLQNFLQHAPNNTQARKILAFAQSQGKNHQKALETLDPFIENPKDLDANTLALLANTSLRAGDAERSTKYLQRALELNPQDDQLRFALAKSFSAQGDFEQAIQELAAINTPDGQPGVKLSKAEIYIKAKDYSNALKTLRELEQILPKNPLAISLQGTVHQLMGDLDTAKTVFHNALKVDPNHIPTIRSLALMEAQSGHEQKAADIYQSALTNAPKNTQLYIDYALFLQHQGKLSEAEEALKNAQAHDSNKVRSSVLLARLYLAQGKPGLAKGELVEYTETKNSAVFAELGNAKMMSGEYKNAVTSYKKLAELEPASPIAYYLISTAHKALGDSKLSNEALDISLEKNQNFVPALLGKANFFLQNKNITKAKLYLQTLEDIASDNDSVKLLKADIAMREDNSAIAVDIYKQLYADNPSDYFLQKVTQSIWKSSSSEQVVSFLTEVINQNKGNIQANYLLATAYEQLSDSPKAIAAYKAVLQLDKNHVIALNNLAWLLKESDPKKALTYAQKALELQPDNDNIKDTAERIKNLIQ